MREAREEQRLNVARQALQQEQEQLAQRALQLGLRPEQIGGGGAAESAAEVRARYVAGVAAEEQQYRERQAAYTTSLRAAPKSVGYSGEMGAGTEGVDRR